MPDYRRLAVLTEGGFDIHRNKTAIGLLRFRPQDVVCVIDAEHAGRTVGDIPGLGLPPAAQAIPVVGSMRHAVRLEPQWLVIGVATPGGFLPQDLRPEVYEAIRNRIGVISGLHDTVNRDPNLVSLAARYCVELVNLRRQGVDDEVAIATGGARATRALRVLTVGTDCNIGKTTTALALHAWLLTQRIGRRPLRARFVATGQDAILITGGGACIDRHIADFASGAVERLVLANAPETDVLMIEGQNGILSPPYSGTALSLVHGACPDAMVLCHAPSRRTFRHTNIPLPPLAEHIRLYEAMLRPLHPGRVVAIALNTASLDDEQAAAAIARTTEETGLPTADPVREGDAGLARLGAALLKLPRRR
jgi:uncharacterized NAD-dependent epimerase/dehydratase family protein